MGQLYTGVTNQTSTSYEFEYANGNGVLTGHVRFADTTGGVHLLREGQQVRLAGQPVIAAVEGVRP